MLLRISPFEAVGAILLMAATVATEAQQGNYGEGHDALHGWYQTLRQPQTGMACCNNEDCRPTKSRRVGATIEVLVDGEWLTVPPDKILDVPSPDLESHVCAAKFARGWPSRVKSDSIYCVVLGAGS